MSNFASDMEKFAYAVGINMGEYVQQMAVKMDGKVVAAGLADYLAGESKLSPEEYAEAMQKLQELMRAAGEKEIEAVGAANREAEMFSSLIYCILPPKPFYGNKRQGYIFIIRLSVKKCQ